MAVEAVSVGIVSTKFPENGKSTGKYQGIRINAIMVNKMLDLHACFTPLVGYVHAIAHRLGENYHVPHGLGNSTDSDTTLARAFIDAVRTLSKQLDIPEKLDVIKSEDIPGLES
jgi:alcohol dehydrogenase class IV